MKAKTFLGLSVTAVSIMALTGCNFISGLTKPTKTVTLKTKDEIKEAIGDNYELNFRYRGESTEDGDENLDATSKVKSANGYTYTEAVDSDNEIVKFISKDNYTYTFSAIDNKYNVMTTEASLIGEYRLGLDSILNFVNSDTITYHESHTDKFLNRDVTVYEFNVSAGIPGVVNVGYSYTYYIDDVTGLCLKLETKGSVSSIEDSGAAGVSYEVTKFVIGGTNIDSEINKVVVKEWPTSTDFSSLNLPNLAPFTNSKVTRAEAKFDGNKVVELEYKNRFEDDDTFIAVLEDIVAKGVNKNFNGETKTLDELKTVDASVISFKACYKADQRGVVEIQYLANQRIAITTFKASL